MKLIITQVSNGFCVNNIDSNDSIVVEALKTESEAVTTQKLLYTIMDCFNLRGSKHDAERCVVKVINPDEKEI